MAGKLFAKTGLGYLYYGDMNAYVGDKIGGNHEKKDKAGERIMEWIEGEGLTLINGTEKCKVVWTWERTQKSAINFCIVNE